MVRDEKDTRTVAKTDTGTTPNDQAGQTAPGFTSGVSGPNANEAAGGGTQHPLSAAEQLRQQQERDRTADHLANQEIARQQMAAETKAREEQQRLANERKLAVDRNKKK